MLAFRTYVTELEELVRTSASENGDVAEQVATALHGGAGTRLRELVSLAERQEAGAFFTGSALAQRAVKRAAPSFDPSSVIYDPACGAGDLLLAAATQMRVTGASTDGVLETWGASLAGRDLEPSFIQAAHLRLALLASRDREHHGYDRVSLARTFRLIVPGCGISDEKALSRASHVLLNPPYAMTVASPGCEWRTGRVNGAAVFIEGCINGMTSGATLVAILPDVLRSGEGYARWRKMVAEKCRVRKIEVIGRFSKWADVDVFMLWGEKQASTRGPSTWIPRSSARQTVGTRFRVSVGPLVAYRTPQTGPWHPFLSTHNATPWGRVAAVAPSRRYSGRLVQPPFVAVRRTSSPGDANRAIATLVTGHAPVAVENHLLVLEPTAGGAKACRLLIANLRDTRTTAWLNRRLRCRHLTVSAIRGIPWW